MGKLKLRDVQFCLGVERIHGVIHAEQGMALFYCPARGIIALYPGRLSAEDYETTKTVYVYNGTNKLRLRRGRDDVLNSEMTQYDLDLLTQFKRLEDMVEAEKIKRIPKIMASYASVIMLVMTGVLAYIFRSYIPMFFAIEGAIVFVGVLSFLSAMSLTKTLNSPRVYDANGCWVNMKTGETNLSGGFKIPSKKEAGLL